MINSCCSSKEQDISICTLKHARPPEPPFAPLGPEPPLLDPQESFFDPHESEAESFLDPHESDEESFGAPHELVFFLLVVVSSTSQAFPGAGADDAADGSSGIPQSSTAAG